MENTKSYMSTLRIAQNYAFGIEPVTNRRFRLIVFKNGEEVVCRKENLKQLKDFLNTDDAKAFKGRLQLYKHRDDIAVEVKGQPIGTLHKADIEACLSKLIN